ncbi:MAG: hypothetical protein ACLRWQ_10405 [Flavonifractor plautii]
MFDEEGTEDDEEVRPGREAHPGVDEEEQEEDEPPCRERTPRQRSRRRPGSAPGGPGQAVRPGLESVCGCARCWWPCCCLPASVPGPRRVLRPAPARGSARLLRSCGCCALAGCCVWPCSLGLDVLLRRSRRPSAAAPSWAWTPAGASACAATLAGRLRPMLTAWMPGTDHAALLRRPAVPGSSAPCGAPGSKRQGLRLLLPHRRRRLRALSGHPGPRASWNGRDAYAKWSGPA